MVTRGRVNENKESVYDAGNSNSKLSPDLTNNQSRNKYLTIETCNLSYLQLSWPMKSKERNSKSREGAK